MSKQTLEGLDERWQQWVDDNLAQGVPAGPLARELFAAGYTGAAFALMTGQQALRQPYLDLKANRVTLSDAEVQFVFVCNKPFVAVMDGFLSHAECDGLIELADSRLKKSRVVNPEDGGFVEHKERTSTGAEFTHGETPLVAAIERRIAELLHFPVENGEGLQVLRYENGGEYRPHFDYFDPNKAGEHKAILAGAGQRVGTFLMYLSDVEEGGGTRFPTMNFEVRPKKGMALYFANVTLDGQTDPQTLHAGQPVTAGVKYLSTKWLREGSFVG